MSATAELRRFEVGFIFSDTVGFSPLSGALVGAVGGVSIIAGCSSETASDKSSEIEVSSSASRRQSLSATTLPDCGRLTADSEIDS